MRRLPSALRDRFLDVVLSIYIHNEAQGYRYLDRLGDAFAERFPEDEEMLAAIRKHARDERKHYDMFRHWFRIRGRMPFRIGRSVGYCDRIVKRVFGQGIADLDPAGLLGSDDAFFRLCRVIMVTEERGMKQVEMVLRNPLVRTDPDLVRIFNVIREDEPSHCEPYRRWLRSRGVPEPTLRERSADLWVHGSTLAVLIPGLFGNPVLRRSAAFP